MGQVQDMLNKRLRPQQPGSESQADISDKEMSDIRREVVKNKMLRDILKEDQGDKGGKEEPTVTAALSKANTELMTTFMNQTKELLAGKGKGEETTFMTYILNKMDKMEEDAKGSDPLSIYRGVQGIINELQSHVTGREEKQVVNTGTDIRLAIELETLKMEREERSRQWEIEKEDRKAAREDANFKWQKEFDLRLREFEAERERKANSGGAFEDLFGAVKDGLQHRQSGAQHEVAAAPPARVKEHVPVKFPCAREGCGTMITMSPPGAETVQCPKCGTIYDLVPADQVGAEPPSAAKPPVAANPPARPAPPAAAAAAPAPALAAAGLAANAAHLVEEELSEEERNAVGE